MNKQLFSFSLSNALFKLAYSLGQTFGVLFFFIIFDNSILIAFGGLFAVMWLHALILTLIAPIIGRIGTRYSLGISNIFFFIAYLLVAFIDRSNPWPYFLGWIVFFSLARAFYFIPYHYFVMHLTESQKRGEEVGKLTALAVLSAMLMPLIGGTVSSIWGVNGVAALAGLLFVSSLAPLVSLTNYKFNYTGHIRQFFKLPYSRKELRMLVGNDIQNKELFWQLYVFLLLGSSFLDFGLLLTLINLFAFSFYWFFGKVLDHRNRMQLVRYSGILSAGAWAYRLLVSTPIGVAISDTIYQLVSTPRNQIITLVDYDLITKEKEEKLLDEKLVTKEVYLNLIAGGFLLLSILLAHFIGLPAVFVLATLGALSLFLIK